MKRSRFSGELSNGVLRKFQESRTPIPPKDAWIAAAAV